MATTQLPLSAYVICRDEARKLPACLESLAGCREIVVVDSGSTDGTLDIVAGYRDRGLPIRLFHNPWPGFARQKQFALDRCAGPWCLSLDADERLSPELARAIAGLPLDPATAAGYRIRMAQFVPGYGYAPAIVHVKPQLRLVHKEHARYDTDLLIHESLIVDGAVEAVRRGRLMHHRDLTIEEETARLNTYSSLKAAAYHAGGRRTGHTRMILAPLARFLKSYVLQRYIVCGRAGFVYSAMLAMYVFLAEAKLYRLQTDDTDEPPRRKA